MILDRLTDRTETARQIEIRQDLRNRAIGRRLWLVSGLASEPLRKGNYKDYRNPKGSRNLARVSPQRCQKAQVRTAKQKIAKFEGECIYIKKTCTHVQKCMYRRVKPSKKSAHGVETSPSLGSALLLEELRSLRVELGRRSWKRGEGVGSPSRIDDLGGELLKALLLKKPTNLRSYSEIILIVRHHPSSLDSNCTHASPSHGRSWATTASQPGPFLRATSTSNVQAEQWSW